MTVKTEWKPQRLDSLGFVGRGKSRHRPRNDARLYGGPYPFIQTADIMAADPYITTFSKTYSEFGLQQSKLWRTDTLCMTIAGANTAQTAILKFDACFPDSVVGFIPDKTKSDLHFVKYSLDLMRHRFLSVSRGATQDNLSLDKLLSFPILAPEVQEQRRIGAILSAYDELIENSQRRFKVLESMARTIYRECLRDKASSSKPQAIVDCSFWSLISANVTPYQGLKRYYATADIDGFAITGLGIDYAFSEKPSRAQKQPVVDSVWFARMKETYKIAWYSNINSDVAENSIISSGFAGFRAIEPVFWPLLFLTISSSEFHVQKDLFCTGATQMSLTNEGLQRIFMPIPNEAASRKLGRHVRPLLNQMLALQIKIGNLRHTRDLLLPRLLSGQITVEAEAA
jgi:type I restriction enzyme S subunit